MTISLKVAKEMVRKAKSNMNKINTDSNTTKQIEEKTDQQPEIKKKTRANSGSKIKTDHGSLEERVYPITESSIRLIITNKESASLVDNLSFIFIGALVSTAIEFFTEKHKRIYIIIFFILLFLSGFMKFLYWRLNKPVKDEWDRIKSSTKF